MNTMSLLRNNDTQTCNCKSKPETGLFSLSVEPVTQDIRDHNDDDYSMQLKKAKEVQELFFPQMQNLSVSTLGDGFHVQPNGKGRVAHIEQLHSVLGDDNLVARMSITPTPDHTSVAVALSKETVSELLSNGTADVKVPLHSGIFRLHSTSPGRITAVEYTC